MSSRRWDINGRIAVEKDGWRRGARGWWIVPGAGVSRDVLDYIAPRANLSWHHRLEHELMLAGWMLAAVDGVFIAHHRDTGREVWSREREEVLVLAYLATDGLRVPRG